MNERIQELIGQAQKEVWGNCSYNGSPEFEGYELDAEKFAELIVKECIKQVFYTIEDEEEDNISSSIGDRIKQHFGVE